MSADEFAEFDISEAEFDAMLAEARAASEALAAFNFLRPGDWYRLNVATGGGVASVGDRRSTQVTSGAVASAATTTA